MGQAAGKMNQANRPGLLLNSGFCLLSPPLASAHSSRLYWEIPQKAQTQVLCGHHAGRRNSARPLPQPHCWCSRGMQSCGSCLSPLLWEFADASSASILEVMEHNHLPFSGGLGFGAVFRVADGCANNAGTRAGQDMAASFPDPRFLRFCQSLPCWELPLVCA